MANFNHERWGMVVGGNRHSRFVVEECLKWAMQRQVFGKALIQQPVIRFKLGQMIADVETVHSMAEDLTCVALPALPPTALRAAPSGPGRERGAACLHNATVP